MIALRALMESTIGQVRVDASTTACDHMRAQLEGLEAAAHTGSRPDNHQVQTLIGVAMQAKCSICGEPTNTLLCLQGGGKWLTGVLMELGVPSSDAKYMISNLLDCEPSEVFNHQEYEDLPLLVCYSCVAKSGKFPPPEPAGIPNPTVLSRPSTGY